MDAKSSRGLNSAYVAAGAIVLVAVVLRFAFLNVVSPDAHYYLLPWFKELSVGGVGALKHGLTGILGDTKAGYAPPYYYLLWLATKFAGVAPALWLIKFVSFCFDPLGAFFAYKIVRLHLSERRAMLAAALVFAAPTAIINDGWFGQCDMIWVSLVLGSLYFALQGKSVLSIAFFALAFSFKAQACFFAPFLFMLLVRGEIKFWAIAVAPLVYAAMLLPAIAVGVNWQVAATTYIRQGDAYHWLSSNAPNLYYFFADHFYTQGVVLGLTLAAPACFALAVLPRLRNATLDINARLLAATLFLAVMPFLLPKMHDRYFFAADLTSIILAVYVPRLWVIPVILQISSLNAYGPMISWTFVHRILTPTMPVAVMLCTAVVVYLVYEFWRVCTQPGMSLGEKTKPLMIAVVAIIVANCVWEAAAVAQYVIVLHTCNGAAAGSSMCMSELHGNWMLNGSWLEWLAFAFIQIGCFFGARWAVTRVWVLLCQDWSTRALSSASV